MVMSHGADLLRRVLCLLLIFVLAWCAIGLPMAHAVVLETAVAVYGAEIILGVLAAAGVAFLSSDDGKRVSTAIWSKLESAKSSAWEKLQSLAQSFVSHQVDQTKASIRVSEALYQEIIDAFNAEYDSTTGSFGGFDSISVTLDRDFFSTFDRKTFALKKYTYAKIASGSDSYIFSVALSDRTFRVTYQVNGGDAQIYDKKLNLQESSIYSPRWVSLYPNKYDSGQVWIYAELNYLHSDGVNWGAADRKTYEVGTIYNAPTATFGYSIDIPAPDLAYPSDDLLVKAPDLPAVDEETGAASWPQDVAYTKDAVTAPYPTTDDGVKVPDIPFDVPIDTTSGKSLTDTEVDTPDVPGTGEDTGTVDWPSAGDLSLPQLIISKFPFSIPFDVARLIGLLEAEPKAPVFVVPLKYGKIMDEEITLDLSQWDDVIRIVRWGELICFVAALAVVTRNYIKW